MEPQLGLLKHHNTLCCLTYKKNPCSEEVGKSKKDEWKLTENDIQEVRGTKKKLQRKEPSFEV